MDSLSNSLSALALIWIEFQLKASYKRFWATARVDATPPLPTIKAGPARMYVFSISRISLGVVDKAA